MTERTIGETTTGAETTVDTGITTTSSALSTTTTMRKTTSPSTSTKSQTQTTSTTPVSVPNPTVKPTTGSTAPTLSVAQKRDQVGFGYYRMGSIEDGLLEAIEEEAAKGHMNVYMTGMAPYNFQNALTMLRKVKEVGGMTWLGIAETAFLFTQPVKVIDRRYRLACWRHWTRSLPRDT